MKITRPDFPKIQEWMRAIGYSDEKIMDLLNNPEFCRELFIPITEEQIEGKNLHPYVLALLVKTVEMLQKELMIEEEIDEKT